VNYYIRPCNNSTAGKSSRPFFFPLPDCAEKIVKQNFDFYYDEGFEDAPSPFLKVARSAIAIFQQLGMRGQLAW
jgi:hypothetical protein